MADKFPKIGWLESFQSRFMLDASTLILFAANLVPLFGVLYWHWDMFLVMILYWMETAIIGFWHILRMVVEAKWFALFLGPFFCLHFGGFMAGHYIFLFALFGKDWAGKIHGVPDFVEQLLLGQGLWAPFLALFLSHGASFILNFYHKLELERPEARPKGGDGTQLEWAQKLSRKGNSLNDIMTAPYRRIIVMHLTILFGGFLTLVFKRSWLVLVLMIGLKVVVDVAAHVRKNFKSDLIDMNASE